MKYLLVLFAVLSLFVGCRHNPEPPQTWLPDPKLERDVREVTENSTVFLGDSLTHIAVWRDFFPEIVTANAGWGGDTTFQVLARLQPIIDAKPKKIFLLIGGNDVIQKFNKAIITGNHAKIIDRILQGAPDTELYVQSILPFGKLAPYYYDSVMDFPPSYRGDIESLNLALALICVQRGIPYINVWSAVVDDEGYLKAEYTADQIHLLEPGYKAWVDYIKFLVRN